MKVKMQPVEQETSQVLSLVLPKRTAIMVFSGLKISDYRRKFPSQKKFVKITNFVYWQFLSK